MKTKTSLLLLSFFTFLSCNLASVYSKFDALPEDRRWFPNATMNYEFNIEDANLQYDITLKFSHVYDYQFATVPIDFTIESPDGKKENISIDLTINDNSGKALADCSGDICDLEYGLKSNTKLQKGNYKITISTSTKLPYLPNVIGVGLEVKKVK
jgi:gliding motility-associated lipoprotein GldH